MYSGKPGAAGNMHVFVACQIDVVNKQLVHPFFLLFFLTVTWLSHGQLWATAEVAASLTRC